MMAREMDTPLSHSNISLKLSEIQRRCEEIREEELSELRLVDAEGSEDSGTDAYNPYNRI
jgi:hypothetical protein